MMSPRAVLVGMIALVVLLAAAPSPAAPDQAGLKRTWKQGGVMRLHYAVDRRFHTDAGGVPFDIHHANTFDAETSCTRLLADGTATITGVFTAASHAEDGGPFGPLRYNSRNPLGPPPAAPILPWTAFPGAAFSFLETSAGRVTLFKGGEAIRKRMLGVMKAPQGAAERIAAGLEERFGDNSLCEPFVRFPALPADPAAPGATWTDEIAVDSMVPMHIQTTYKLVAVTSDTCTLAGEGVIRPEPGISRAGVAYDFHGTTKGEYKVDTKTGRTLSAKIQDELSGTSTYSAAKGRGVTSPISLKQTVDIATE